MFKEYRYSTLLQFDELKIGENENEIADVYLRYSNKILLAQVKSGSIYDDQKFGGDLESLYRGNRSKFYENYGLKQLVKSIVDIEKYMYKTDVKYPKGHQKKIFPVLIVNEKVLQTPLMPQSFNYRFQELLNDYTFDKCNIYPLTIIHISDLELIQRSISSNPKQIWKLLEHATKDKDSNKPFYIIVNQDVASEHPQEIVNFYRSLFDEIHGSMEQSPL